MRVLVTGGAGFIGSHVTDLLVEAGHRVAVVDNLSSGRIEHVNKRAKLYVVDVCDQRIRDVFAEFAPEAVIHLAAQTSVQSSLRDPCNDANVNIIGTVSLLERCRDFHVQKIIYASSAAAYGVPEYLAVDERHPARPLSCYGLSKYTAERYIQMFADLYGIDYTILRFSNVYGERQGAGGEGGVVSVFLSRLLHGGVPLIFGDGEQTRDFIYVRDVAAANVASLTKGSRGIYNISRNEVTSVNELLHCICSLYDKPFTAEYRPARKGEILHSRLDNSAACRDLGWEPKYSLFDGLRMTIEDYIMNASHAV